MRRLSSKNSNKFGCKSKKWDLDQNSKNIIYPLGVNEKYTTNIDASFDNLVGFKWGLYVLVKTTFVTFLNIMWHFHKYYVYISFILINAKLLAENYKLYKPTNLL